MNCGLSLIGDDFVFQIEDDYLLNYYIDITPYVHLMLENAKIG